MVTAVEMCDLSLVAIVVVCAFGCRSDPVLQRNHAHDDAAPLTPQSLTVAPPTEGAGLTAVVRSPPGSNPPGSNPPVSSGSATPASSTLIRDNSIKNLINSFENKLQEVQLSQSSAVLSYQNK